MAGSDLTAMLQTQTLQMSRLIFLNLWTPVTKAEILSRRPPARIGNPTFSMAVRVPS